MAQKQTIKFCVNILQVLRNVMEINPAPQSR